MANLYEVGDRVRVTNGGYNDVYDGSEGTVTYVPPSGVMYDVEVDGISGARSFWEYEIIGRADEKEERGINMTGLAALREALAEKVSDTFEDGTVFRWTSGGKYDYAAIKAGGRYWLSGTYDFYNNGGVTDYTGLLDIFSRPDVTDIKIATGWEAV